MRKQHSPIAFPANPFVALADFVMVVLCILILAFVHQSISTNRLFERMAVDELQNRLLNECKTANRQDIYQSSVYQAYQQGLIKESHRDGDLQRFWFDGSLFYNKTNVTPKARWAVLIGFGRILSRYGGNLNDPGSGLYKRIAIQGNADRSEGTDLKVWQLSLSRAQEAALVLQTDANVSPKLIEASGRGCWDPKALPADTPPGEMVARNRRLEIVILYSGKRAVEFSQALKKKH